MSTIRDAVGHNGSHIFIPRPEWENFLESMSRTHRGQTVTIGTYDLQTKEEVVSQEVRLTSVEFDLEDEKHPRINVHVAFENKGIKQILYEPSQLILQLDEHGGHEILHVQSVNTHTTVRFSDSNTRQRQQRDH
jgi:hypothetical protein